MDSGRNRTEKRRQLMRLECKPGDNAEAAATAAFETPEEVGIGARIGDPDGAVGGDDLGLQQPGGGAAEVLREAAETTCLHQSGDADRAAAPTLHIAAAFGRHLVIGMHPDGPGSHGDRRLGRFLRRASLRDEIVVECHGVHMPGPDQQRSRCIRPAEVAVAAALDDQPQIVLARKVDRRDDIGGRFGRHGIDARLKHPGIDPARGLRQTDLVTDVIGIFQFPEEIAARRPIRRVPAGAQRRCTLISRPPTSRFSLSQLAASGHDGSDGRTRLAAGLAATGSARESLGKTGTMTAAAPRVSKLLLFMSIRRPTAR